MSYSPIRVINANTFSGRRQAQKSDDKENVPVESWCEDTQPVKSSQELDAQPLQRSPLQEDSVLGYSHSVYPYPPSLNVLTKDRKSQILKLYWKIMEEKEHGYPLPADHLLSLVYYNVYRALVANVRALGLDLDLMATDDYPSPFTPGSPTASSALRNLPPTLQPTKLQLTVPHHPQWDIVPDSVTRENILRRGQEDVNDAQLCLDLIGTESRRKRYRDSSAGSGCRVWGEPGRLDNWEIDADMVRASPWMFVGGKDIEASTNRWRVARGEEPLDFAALGVPQLDDDSDAGWTSEVSWQSSSGQ